MGEIPPRGETGEGSKEVVSPEDTRGDVSPYQGSVGASESTNPRLRDQS